MSFRHFLRILCRSRTDEADALKENELSVAATTLSEQTPVWTGTFTADATSTMIGPHLTVVQCFHLDITAAGWRNALTIDKKVIVWHILSWSKCCSSIVTQMEDPCFDSKPGPMYV